MHQYKENNSHQLWICRSLVARKSRTNIIDSSCIKANKTKMPIRALAGVHWETGIRQVFQIMNLSEPHCRVSCDSMHWWNRATTCIPSTMSFDIHPFWWLIRTELIKRDLSPKFKSLRYKENIYSIKGNLMTAKHSLLLTPFPQETKT